MSFLAPAMLASLAALIPFAAVYFLKVRPRRRGATALFLWERVYSEKKATSLFRRLRDFLSLLLMLLAVAALCLALARPQFGQHTQKDLLILIDRSASMSAREPDGRRLSLARERAHALVRGLTGDQRAAVASVAHEVTFHAHLSRDPKRLHGAIDDISASELPLRPKAIETFASQHQWAKDYRILLLSDHAGGNTLAETIEQMPIGSRRDNAGIIACDMRRLPGEANRLGLYVRLASSFEKPIERDLVLRRDGMTRRRLPVTIEPGENAPQVEKGLTGKPGKWTVTLAGNDALPTDNRAYLTVPEPRPLRIGVTTDNAYFYQHSVLAFARRGLLTLADDNPELVIATASVPKAPLALVFAPTGESQWWHSVAGPIDRVVPRVVREDHPALRFLDLSAMSFAGARQLQVPERAVVLVRDQRGTPLIWQMRDAKRSGIVVNCSPKQAELFLSAHFPVLIHNTVTHLSGRGRERQATHALGNDMPLPGARPGETSTITLPTGEQRQTTSDHFGPLARPGFYRIDNASGQWLAAASLNASKETLLRGPDAAQAAPTNVRQGRPPATSLIVFALGALVLEGLLYHRRKVG